MAISLPGITVRGTGADYPTTWVSLFAGRPGRFTDLCFFAQDEMNQIITVAR